MPVSHVLPRRRDCGQGSKGEERCGGGLPGGCHRRHGHLLASAAAAGAIRQSCAAPHTAASLLLRTPTARSPGRPIHLAFLCVFHSTGHLCSACAPLILLRRYSLRLLLCWPTRVAKPGEPQAPGRDGNKQWQCERNAGGEGKPLTICSGVGVRAAALQRRQRGGIATPLAALPPPGVFAHKGWGTRGLPCTPGVPRAATPRVAQPHVLRHCTPAQRAMSMKFSPPTTLLAKRIARVVR